MVNFLAKGALDRLTRRFAERLPAKVGSVAADVDRALSTPWSQDLGDTACRGLHSLMGSSGTYGFVEISRVARRAETLIRDSVEGDSLLPPHKEVELRQLLDRLGVLAAEAADQGAPPS